MTQAHEDDVRGEEGEKKTNNVLKMPGVRVEVQITYLYKISLL